MHSGNVGYAQDLETLIYAATFLRDLEDIQFVIVGSGALGGVLAAPLARSAWKSNTYAFCPTSRASAFQSPCRRQTFTWWALRPGWPATWSTSRLYGILAVGRPVIVHADEDSETAEIVIIDNGCGVVVPPGRTGAARARDPRRLRRTS